MVLSNSKLIFFRCNSHVSLYSVIQVLIINKRKSKFKTYPTYELQILLNTNKILHRYQLVLKQKQTVTTMQAKSIYNSLIKKSVGWFCYYYYNIKFRRFKFITINRVTQKHQYHIRIPFSLNLISIISKNPFSRTSLIYKKEF